jgi:MoaA/NifB/PqqE/SkfB family radical SAM enzyme
MFYQLEITTRCNFACFYCAGRDMPQRDMAWDTFIAIVDRIPGMGSTVSLQGEGEPSLHPKFEAMARHVATRGHKPYTILNASRLDPERLPQLFPTVGLSVDTLDEQLAHQLGRHNLPKVLRNIESLCQAMDPKRITIMTVNMGQPLDDLRRWVKLCGFGQHIVQQLSPKSDYARRYTVNSQLIAPSGPSTCRYLQRQLMRFYTWDGRELPCCFMKNSTDFTTTQQLSARLASGLPSSCCDGCPQLTGEKRSAPLLPAML